jgi:hypothetical protein
MGSTYRAMLRAERERSGRSQPVPHTPEAEELDFDEQAARPVSGEIDWGAFVFDQVGSIDQRLDAFDEALHKQVPELEGRLLHLLELRLGSLERSVFSRIGGLSRELIGAGGLRQRLLLGVLGLLGLNLLLLGAVLSKLS